MVPGNSTKYRCQLYFRFLPVEMKTNIWYKSAWSDSRLCFDLWTYHTYVALRRSEFIIIINGNYYQCNGLILYSSTPKNIIIKGVNIVPTKLLISLHDNWVVLISQLNVTSFWISKAIFRGLFCLGFTATVAGKKWGSKLM